MSTVEVKKLSGHTPVQVWSLSVSKHNRPFVTSTKKVTAGGSVGLFVSKITRKVLSSFMTFSGKVDDGARNVLFGDLSRF